MGPAAQRFGEWASASRTFSAITDAQRFGEWASASRTFSAITDLIAVVQREVDRCFVFIFQSMHLPAGIAVDCSYVLAAKASPPGVGDGTPCRPTLRRRVGVSPGLLV